MNHSKPFTQITKQTKIASACMIAASALMHTGCGASATPEAKSEKPAAVATESTNNATETKSPSTQIPASENKKVEAEITSFEPAPSNDTPSPKTEEVKAAPTAAVQPIPTTARKAIAEINLTELPRLGSENLLQSGPTYFYYGCKAKLPEADAFYTTWFKSNGWQEQPNTTPPTEHYIDRLFSKNGYFVRAALSVGGEPGELGIMLSNMGNVDVGLLPKLPDAEVMFEATPVNLTYQTKSSIPEAADAVNKQMLAQGWQPWRDFHDNPISVPHYKDLHYRKGACRLLVGIVKNPQNPADKTSVSYISEFVTPFDLPMLSDGQILKLDLFSKRASFEAANSRKELVSLLQFNSENFGWKLRDADKFENGDAHMMPIDLESGEYVVARLVESSGKYSASLECYEKRPESSAIVTDSVASATEDPEMQDVPAEPMEKNETIDNIESQVNSAIQGELAKALGSLGQPSADGPANLAELQAKAKELQNMFGDDESESDEEKSEQNEMAENPFDASEDEEAPSAEIQAINKTKCTIKTAGKSIELPYYACYVLNDSGATEKCILFSNKPIDYAKLQRLLLKEAGAVHGIYVSEDATMMLDFRVIEESISLNAQIDSSSLGLSAIGTLPVDISFYQGKVMGTISTKEPIELSQGTLEFTIEINEKPIQVDWNKRGSAELSKLVVDESKEVLIPEGCTSYSAEGSRYSNKVEATIDEPLAAVQEFYREQLEQKGWKLIDGGTNSAARYRSKEQEIELSFDTQADETSIHIQTRDLAAAKADAMLPPPGKALLVLGNMTDAAVEMSIGGKTYSVKPSDGGNPKDATKVVVEPGAVKVRVVAEKGGKKFDMEVDATADSTWGVLFDTTFQDTMRLF